MTKPWKMDQYYNISFTEGNANAIIEGKVLYDCMNKAYDDLYSDVDILTVDPDEMKEKLEEQTIKHLYLHEHKRDS